VTYRALACDYDGTIATAGRVDAGTIEALSRLKGHGWSLILVTGRMLEDLRLVFPGLDLFDLAVVENGGILFRPAEKKFLTLAPVPSDGLVKDLRQAGIPITAGHVVLATERKWASSVTEFLAARGVSLQLVYNRDSLMLLPQGVDKASGLRAAIKELALMPDECVGVGDAENDRALLSTCGLGVAVGNAVQELKEEADFITDAPAGGGVVELIDRLLM
jgi:hydroxymethylpyrimidine pyrophosphatase-like HAD family hydrolase